MGIPCCRVGKPLSVRGSCTGSTSSAGSWVRCTVSELQLTVNLSLMNLSEISVGRGKGRIPWARLKEAPGDFILSKYLPASVMLTQYHHIHQEDVNTLLKHWTQRQAAGKIPFRFKMRDVRRGQAQENDEETPGDGNALTKEGADGNSQEDGAGGPSGVSKLLVLTAYAYHLFPHLQPPQPHPHHSASSQRHGNGAKVREELPEQGDQDLSLHPPNALPLHTRPRPRPCIITQCRSATGSSRVDQAAKASTSHRHHKSVHNTAADTRPPKRQKVGDSTINAQPETRRSGHATQPTEWVKQTQ